MMKAEMRFKQTISEPEKRKAITFRCQNKDETQTAATIIMIMQHQCLHTDIYFTMAMFSSRFIKHQAGSQTMSKIGLLRLSIEHRLT